MIPVCLPSIYIFLGTMTTHIIPANGSLPSQRMYTTIALLDNLVACKYMHDEVQQCRSSIIVTPDVLL